MTLNYQNNFYGFVPVLQKKEVRTGFVSYSYHIIINLIKKSFHQLV